MYDFFACDDAIVLDEGYDTFHIINPGNETDGSYMYSNEKLLDKVLKFTTDRIDEDQQNSLNRPETPAGMKGLLLNKKLILNIEEQAKQVTDPKISYDDVLAVPPNRSQMRSVIIFAARK